MTQRFGWPRDVNRDADKALLRCLWCSSGTRIPLCKGDPLRDFFKYGIDKDTLQRPEKSSVSLFMMPNMSTNGIITVSEIATVLKAAP